MTKKKPNKQTKKPEDIHGLGLKNLSSTMQKYLTPHLKMVKMVTLVMHTLPQI